MSFGDIMKQAQAMQEKMQAVQEQIAALKVEGESGAGLVKVFMTGKYECLRVAINPNVLADTSDEGREVLEDLVAAAINDAKRKVEEGTKAAMDSATGGLNLPPGFKLPF